MFGLIDIDGRFCILVPYPWNNQLFFHVVYGLPSFQWLTPFKGILRAKSLATNLSVTPSTVHN